MVKICPSSAAISIASSEFSSIAAVACRKIACWKRIVSAAAAATAIQTRTVRLSVVSREKTEADNNIIIVSWRCSARGVSRRTKTTGKFAPGQPRWRQSSVLFLFPVRRHRVYSEYSREQRNRPAAVLDEETCAYNK